MSKVPTYSYWVDGEPGIQPVSMPASCLDEAIDRVSLAYEVLYTARWSVVAPDRTDLLDEALTLVGRCFDSLDEERQTLQEKEPSWH